MGPNNLSRNYCKAFATLNGFTKHQHKNILIVGDEAIAFSITPDHKTRPEIRQLYQGVKLFYTLWRGRLYKVNAADCKVDRLPNRRDADKIPAKTARGLHNFDYYEEIVDLLLPNAQ